MADYPCLPSQLPAITEADYIALRASIMEGAKRVKYADKEVEYQSLTDMWRILNWMQGLLYPCSVAGKISKVAAEYDPGFSSRPYGLMETEEFRYR